MSKLPIDLMHIALVLPLHNIPSNHILLFLVVSVCTSSIKFNEYITDVGNTISIPCLAEGSIFWVKEEWNETKEFLVCLLFSKFFLFFF